MSITLLQTLYFSFLPWNYCIGTAALTSQDDLWCALCDWLWPWCGKCNGMLWPAHWSESRTSSGHFRHIAQGWVHLIVRTCKGNTLKQECPSRYFKMTLRYCVYTIYCIYAIFIYAIYGTYAIPWGLGNRNIDIFNFLFVTTSGPNSQILWNFRQSTAFNSSYYFPLYQDNITIFQTLSMCRCPLTRI